MNRYHAWKRCTKLKQSLHRGELIIFAFIFSLFLCSQTAQAANYFNWGVENLRPSFGVNGTDPYDVQFKHCLLYTSRCV